MQRWRCGRHGACLCVLCDVILRTLRCVGTGHKDTWYAIVQMRLGMLEMCEQQHRAGRAHFDTPALEPAQKEPLCACMNNSLHWKPSQAMTNLDLAYLMHTYNDR